MDLYREEILEHWKSPLNYGKLADVDLVVEQVNPICGDEITFFFKFSKKGNLKIEKVSFEGKGCAISIAAASMLSENIKGKPVSAIGKITGKDVMELMGTQLTPARLKCAFLSLEAIRKLNKNN